MLVLISCLLVGVVKRFCQSGNFEVNEAVYRRLKSVGFLGVFGWIFYDGNSI